MTEEEIKTGLKLVDFHTIDAERFERNEDKYYSAKDGTFQDQCCCCGKGIKEVKFMICRVVFYQSVCPANTTEEELKKYEIQSQGCFAIGSECKKHYSKEYILII